MRFLPRDPATGEPRGVSIDLGVPVDLVLFDAAGKVFEALKTGAWDVAFLAIDPARATEIAFTTPYVLIECTYLVPADSPLQTIEDVDRDGVRIAVARNAAYDLFLTRTLKHAQIVHAPSPSAALELFLNEWLDAVARVRQPLFAAAEANPSLRVMEGRFMGSSKRWGRQRVEKPARATCAGSSRT
jgi:polar amino acid transport system substrate-binding protein